MISSKFIHNKTNLCSRKSTKSYKFAMMYFNQGPAGLGVQGLTPPFFAAATGRHAKEGGQRGARASPAFHLGGAKVPFLNAIESLFRN